jgi:hypothetical protein
LRILYCESLKVTGVSPAAGLKSGQSNLKRNFVHG